MSGSGLQDQDRHGEGRDAPRRAEVVFNRRAGTVLEQGEEPFRRALAEAFAAHGVEAKVTAVAPEELEAATRRAIEAAPDLIVVGGGDGTVSKLLPVLARSQAPIGILPFGTLNLLARDLGLTQDVRETVASLAGGRAVAVDLAAVNGRPFHSNAGLGLFTAMAREREQARRTLPGSIRIGYALAALRAVLRSRAVTVEIEADGQCRTLVADAVLVTNNRFEGTPWLRPSLDEGMLEVHLLDAGGLGGRFRALVAMARGTWRELPRLTSLPAREVTLRLRRRRFSVAVDGEIQRFRGELHCTIRPRALRLLAGRAAGSLKPDPSPP